MLERHLQRLPRLFAGYFGYGMPPGPDPRRAGQRCRRSRPYPCACGCSSIGTASHASRGVAAAAPSRSPLRVGLAEALPIRSEPIGLRIRRTSRERYERHRSRLARRNGAVEPGARSDRSDHGECRRRAGGPPSSMPPIELRPASGDDACGFARARRGHRRAGDGRRVDSRAAILADYLGARRLQEAVLDCCVIARTRSCLSGC